MPREVPNRSPQPHAYCIVAHKSFALLELFVTHPCFGFCLGVLPMSFAVDGLFVKRRPGSFDMSDAPSGPSHVCLSHVLTTPDLRALWSILRPSTTLTEHFVTFFSPTLVLTIALSLGATSMLAVGGKEFRASGRDGGEAEVPAWQPYLVANLMLWGIVLMIRGYRSEFVLLGELTVFGMCGIVDKRDGLAGFMNDGNIIGACLSIIVLAIAKAGVLEQFALAVLGEPQSGLSALIRVLLPSMPAAGFMNSAAVANVMTPLVTNWAKRLGLDDRALLLPMAVSFTIGGSLCVLGCGPAMVTRGSFAREMDMRVTTFAITPVGFTLCAFYLLWCLSLGRALSPRRSEASGAVAVAPASAVPRVGFVYRVEIRVDPDCMLLSRSIGGTGLDRLEGVRVVRVSGQSGGAAEDQASVAAWVLGALDTLVADMTARGAATMRQVRGLRFQSSELHRSQLGGRRHRRILAEAVISPSSSLIGRSLVDMWSDVDFLFRLPAAILAARRPGGLCVDTTPLAAGDVLLAETDADFPSKATSARHFSVVAMTPDSQPLRDRPLDLARGYGVFALMLGATVAPAVVEEVELVWMVIMVCFACILSRAVTPEDAWSSVKGQLYVSVAAGFGVGKAMENSGLTMALAQGVLWMVGSDDVAKVMLALGAVATLLTQFLSNTATCVLMMPIVKSVVEAGGFHEYRRAMGFLLIFCSNASYATPIGTPPNLIVSTTGADYTWGEFFKFGFPLQVVCLPLTTFLVVQWYGPEAVGVRTSVA